MHCFIHRRASRSAAHLRDAASLLLVLLAFAYSPHAQSTAAAKVKLGSETAKNGFRNEDEIRDKFNNWKTDADARAWLTSMKYQLDEIEGATAAKPHGEKADVEVRIKTRKGDRVEGISIKLVSGATGFNQIDKRWLATYAKKWRMPASVHGALKRFVGEEPPDPGSKKPDRMFLNELDAASQKAVVDFFTANRDEIVSDLFAGDGLHAAQWMMVAFKAMEPPKWIIRSSADAVRFYSEGKVEITRAGNLKIGRVTMQRKGGDGGRESAKMLQFKINPVALFDAK